MKVDRSRFMSNAFGRDRRVYQTANRNRTTTSFSSHLNLLLLVFRPFSNVEVVGQTSPSNPTITFDVGPEDEWLIYASNIDPSDMLTLVHDLSVSFVSKLILTRDSLGPTELALLSNVTSLEELILATDWVSLDGIQSLTQLKTLTLDNNSPVTDAELIHVKELVNLQGFNSVGVTNITNSGMLHLAAISGMRTATLNRTQVDQNGIGVLLGGLGDLKSLFMERLNVTDALLPLIQSQSMIALDFDETDISDAGAANLASITTLEHLDLKDTKGGSIQNATMNLLCSSLINLKSFSVTSKDITNVGLENLAGLSFLEELDLNNTGLSDGIIPDIGALGLLKSLNLSSTAISDVETDHFTNLVLLKELNCNGTGITDLTLSHIYGLTELAYLNVQNTGVSPAGVAALQTALPDLVIDS